MPTHLEIVDQIAGFLDSYDGGPASFYDAIGSSYREAAASLPQVADAAQRETYLRWMEGFARRCSDFGYGLDSETAEVLEELRDRLISTTPGMGGAATLSAVRGTILGRAASGTERRRQLSERAGVAQHHST